MMPLLRTLAAALVATAVVVSATAAPAAAAPPTGPGSYGSSNIAPWDAGSRYISPAATVDSADVWLIGDSITVAGHADFTADLLAINGLTVAVNAWSGRPTRPAVDALEQWVADYGPPQVVVMATGTNDIFGPAPDYGPPIMPGQIDRVMALVGPDVKVVWIETYIARWAQADYVQYADLRNTGWVNSFLWDATARHPGRLSVSIWARYLAVVPTRVPAYLTDGVHLNTTGMNARNELARQAVVRALGI